MTTRLHQTWDLGVDGQLTVDLTHRKPLPSAAYAVLSALAGNIGGHAGGLRMLLEPEPAPGEPGGDTP